MSFSASTFTKSHPLVSVVIQNRWPLPPPLSSPSQPPHGNVDPITFLHFHFSLPHTPSFSYFPLSLTLAQRTGCRLLAEGLLQAADDAALVPQALAVWHSQSFHLPAVLDAVSLQLHPVLVDLLLQLLKVGVLLQKTQQVGHHRHQGRVCQLGNTEARAHAKFNGAEAPIRGSAN